MYKMREAKNRRTHSIRIYFSLKSIKCLEKFIFLNLLLIQMFDYLMIPRRART